MDWIKTLYKTEKPIIAMLHLLPMPSDPNYDPAGGMDKVIERARRDIHALQNGGVDAILVCNEYSLPYLYDVEPCTVAAMAYLIGVGTKLRKQKGMFLLFLIFGTAANYAVGVLMFCILMKASFWTGFTACVLPFLPTAVIKAAAASVLGLKLQVRLGEVMQWT